MLYIQKSKMQAVQKQIVQWAAIVTAHCFYSRGNEHRPLDTVCLQLTVSSLQHFASSCDSKHQLTKNHRETG